MEQKTDTKHQPTDAAVNQVIMTLLHSYTAPIQPKHLIIHVETRI